MSSTKSSSNHTSIAGPSTSMPIILSNSSNNENSYDNSSSDNSDSDDSSNHTNTIWTNNYKDIPDFNFNSTISGIKLNIEDTAKDSPYEIFKQIWTNEISDIIIKSINEYGKNKKN